MARNGIITERVHVPAKPLVAATDNAVERGIQLVSRWAGILAFVAALVGIGVLIF